MQQSSVFLYAAALSFFIGVAAASLLENALPVALFLGVVAAALFLLYLGSRTRAVLLVVLMFALAALGMGRFLLAETLVEENRQEFAQTEQDMIHGTVVGEVVVKETTQRFIVKTDTTKVIITTNHFPRVFYGNRVVLDGRVIEPERFETDIGRVFNYPEYLAARGVTHQMFYPEIEIVDDDLPVSGTRQAGGGLFILRGLFRLKETFLTNIQQVLPEPHVALLGGLVVGSQEAMGEELLDAFRITGLIHIVVLSGYNVTIVAESIMRFFGFLPRRFKMAVGAVSIVLFAILTGASATIVRASIMALLVILARVTGRTYEIIRALVITAFLMVLYNPYTLLFDPSFQLSFLATLGLIFLVPVFEQRFTRSGRKVSPLWSLLFSTLATQLFVLPLLLYQVGLLSAVSLPVNALVLPVVPITMLFGFLTGVVGFISTALAMPLGFVTYGLLAYALQVVDWFATVPFAAVHIERFPAWGVVLAYIVYAAVLYILFRKLYPQTKETIQSDLG